MLLGELVVNLRNQKGVKQKDLAEHLGISATHLSLIESDRSKPSPALIKSIADYFGLPVSALLYKAINKEATTKEQKKFQEVADPVVDALINFLISDDSKKERRNRPPVSIK